MSGSGLHPMLSTRSPLLFLSLYWFSCNITFEKKCSQMSSSDSCMYYFNSLQFPSSSPTFLFSLARVTNTCSHLFYTLPSSPLQGKCQYGGAFVCFAHCCVPSTLKSTRHVVGFRKYFLLSNISVCTDCPTSLSYPFHTFHPHSQRVKLGDSASRNILVLPACSSDLEQ